MITKSNATKEIQSFIHLITNKEKPLMASSLIYNYKKIIYLIRFYNLNKNDNIKKIIKNCPMFDKENKDHLLIFDLFDLSLQLNKSHFKYILNIIKNNKRNVSFFNNENFPVTNEIHLLLKYKEYLIIELMLTSIDLFCKNNSDFFSLKNIFNEINKASIVDKLFFKKNGILYFQIVNSRTAPFIFKIKNKFICIDYELLQVEEYNNIFLNYASTIFHEKINKQKIEDLFLVGEKDFVNSFSMNSYSDVINKQFLFKKDIIYYYCCSAINNYNNLNKNKIKLLRLSDSINSSKDHSLLLDLFLNHLSGFMSSTKKDLFTMDLIQSFVSDNLRTEYSNLSNFDYSILLNFIIKKIKSIIANMDFNYSFDSFKKSCLINKIEKDLLINSLYLVFLQYKKNNTLKDILNSDFDFFLKQMVESYSENAIGLYLNDEDNLNNTINKLKIINSNINIDKLIISLSNYKKNN